MTAKELMMPRYELMVDYPGSTYPVGTIFTSMPNGFVHYMLNDEKHSTNGLNLEKYPYLFRRMNWWEKRSVKDMPKRLKNRIVDGINEIEELDMNMCKKNVSDNPYEGGTLYSVLRDRILEKEKLPLNCTISNDNMVRELLHTPMEELVPMLVQHELEKANAKFPQFASDMEGWAVLKEEIEEADEELVNIRRWHDKIWIAIRGNRKLHSDYIRLIRTLAQKMMVEAAQVAAMALKYEAMLERNEKKEEE